MDESAKTELEHHVRLYQFHVDCYIKGIAFFLAITAALLKIAVDSQTFRVPFAIGALLCTVAISLPIVFGFTHEKRLVEEFQRLAVATKTRPLSTAPLRMLARTAAFFWFIVAGGWIYILFRLR